jgi:hypothetical protein
MPSRGIYVGDAGGRLRVAGQLVEISSAGRDGNYKLVVNDGAGRERVEILLSEEAVDELEEVMAALRTEQPKYEKSQSFSPLVMKKFMLDNSIFPKWPAREMIPVYRQEGALISQEEILEWRKALQLPDEKRTIYAKLMMSVTRREVKDYCRLVHDEVAGEVKKRAPQSYAKFGRAAVLNEIEQNLFDAYPNDALDGEGILAGARISALSQVLAEARPPSVRVGRLAISGAFPNTVAAQKTYRLPYPSDTKLNQISGK